MGSTATIGNVMLGSTLYLTVDTTNTEFAGICIKEIVTLSSQKCTNQSTNQSTGDSQQKGHTFWSDGQDEQPCQQHLGW